MRLQIEGMYRRRFSTARPAMNAKNHCHIHAKDVTVSLQVCKPPKMEHFHSRLMVLHLLAGE